ncbi:MAG TPA: ABC transporter ATP-binding protein [Tepidisphaeraceae bacterium]|jgi:putative ABC transport system ATP-binding protein|nr:ABC transporter ATP-binding protein [Tepidisphaeraceae bacterium]
MAIELDHVRKQYVAPDGTIVPVIDIDKFSIADGEQAALIGTSGSGKTTLLHMIAGILTPDSGSIRFSSNGSAAVDIAKLSEAQRDVFRGQNVGYIFQTHHLLPGFTALENVLLGMSFTGRSHDANWAKHLLTEVGLADRLHYKPQKLSVGQQQRVAAARALANRPKLVLADEPTGALDSTNARQVLDLIRKLCTEVGSSLLLVSHDLNIAKQLGRVVTLTELNRAGRVSSS